MNIFPLNEFYRNIDQITSITTAIEEHAGKNDGVIPETAKKVVNNSLLELKSACKSAGLKLPLYSIARLQLILNQKVSKNTEFITKYKDFKKRLNDEITTPFFMVLPSEKLDFYTKTNLFGDDVFDKLSSANFDIEEAGKCFATARYTACVMHLQRVMEVGLKSYGNLLSIASLAVLSQPSWNRVLDETRKEIKERNDKLVLTKLWLSNEEKEFCEGVQPFLEAIKIAWRNPTMHVDKKYIEEEAEDIFSSVKGLMRHLAKHLDESGRFTP